MEYEIVEVDAEIAAADSAEMLEQYPFRSAAAIGHVLRPYVEDKIFCDLGCGGGDLAWLMCRWAAHVVGVELNKHRFQLTYEPSPSRTHTNIEFKNSDFLIPPMVAADVYFNWTSASSETLVELLEAEERPCLLVIATRNPPSRPGLLRCVDEYSGKLVAVPTYEESGNHWPDEDVCRLGFIPLSGAKI